MIGKLPSMVDTYCWGTVACGFDYSNKWVTNFIYFFLDMVVYHGLVVKPLEFESQFARSQRQAAL